MALAVTRSGFGAVWRFEDRYAALRHPLVQPGDAVLDEATDLLRLYSPAQLPRLCESQGAESLGERVAAWLLELGAQPVRHVCEILERDRLHEDVWMLVERVAKDPPQDPAIVLDLVQQDRDHELQERRMTKADKAPATEKVAKEPKVAAEKTIKGVDGADLPLTTRLTFGTKEVDVPAVKDKDGKETKAATKALVKYDGAENNPKSRGARERFAKYKHNITIGQAIDSGVNAADIAWDLKKGFVVVNTAAK